MAKNKKKRTMAQALATAKREAMKKAGFLDGRFGTRTSEPTIKQKNRRDRHKAKKELRD